MGLCCCRIGDFLYFPNAGANSMTNNVSCVIYFSAFGRVVFSFIKLIIMKFRKKGTQ